MRIIFETSSGEFCKGFGGVKGHQKKKTTAPGR